MIATLVVSRFFYRITRHLLGNKHLRSMRILGLSAR